MPDNAPPVVIRTVKSRPERRGGKARLKRKRVTHIVTYYVEKTKNWYPVYSKGNVVRCRTNVEVWKRVVVDGVVISEEKVPLEARKPTKKKNEAFGDSWRIRVTLGVKPGKENKKRKKFPSDYYRQYLHKIIAFAYGRRKFGKECKSYEQFVDRNFEGDHLPVVVNGRLETRPELCIAGWVEAVSPAEHRRRTAMLGVAREIEVTVQGVLKVEKQHNDHDKALKAKLAAALATLPKKKGVPRKRTLSQLQAEIDENKEKVAEAAALRGRAAEIYHDFEILKQGFLTCTLDEFQANPFDGTTTEDFDNPYACMLIIECEGTMREKFTAMAFGVQNRKRMAEFAQKGVQREKRARTASLNRARSR